MDDLPSSSSIRGPWPICSCGNMKRAKTHRLQKALEGCGFSVPGGVNVAPRMVVSDLPLIRTPPVPVWQLDSCVSPASIRYCWPRNKSSRPIWLDLPFGCLSGCHPPRRDGNRWALLNHNPASHASIRHGTTSASCMLHHFSSHHSGENISCASIMKPGLQYSHSSACLSIHSMPSPRRSSSAVPARALVQWRLAISMETLIYPSTWTASSTALWSVFSSFGTERM